ncbi:MAG TPA: Rieske (2Fe-2S) protein [Thermoanaerobaculia bacterium]|jgi:Rieske Fe-S protein
MSADVATNDDENGTGRRPLLSWLSTLAMVGGVGAAYATLAAFMGRFLYPARPARRGWMYVTEADDVPSGGSIVFRTPAGATVNVARRGGGRSAEDFVALSSVCPHLGCQVHWEGHNDRFFCPCHNGVFDPDGIATGGPPGEAGQRLSRYPLKVESGLVFIELPLAVIARGDGRVEAPPRPTGPGHDPCLAGRPPAAEA